MSKLLKQLLAVVLAFQTSLTGISATVHAEEPEEEPEYTAETITEEDETVLTEENEEDPLIILEQEEETPEETAVPETEEEPAETAEPEETTEQEMTEEPELPEVTEKEEVTAPEETELPEQAEEEPEETGEPVPEEEVPEEIEAFEEFTDLEDAEMMSEPIGAHDLEENAGMLEIQNVLRENDEQITATAVWKFSAPVTVYLIAENASTRYFLGEYEMPGKNVPFKFDHITPGLPEGQYTLRAAVNTTAYEKPTLIVSQAYSQKLQILPQPDVSVSKQDNGSSTGELQVKLPDLTYIDRLIFNSEIIYSDIETTKSQLTAKAVKGVYTLSGMPSDWYNFWYTGVSTSDVIAVSGGVKNVSVPMTKGPVLMDAWIEKKGSYYGNASNFSGLTNNQM